MNQLNKELIVLINAMINNYKSLGYQATADYYCLMLTEKLKIYERTNPKNN